ncbi:phospholipase D-like domain-containing protein [Nocardia terpenica]|uniref:phospholipase D n=1 Tax=Nocardia terpenica TaxID=455432 RepID=A0A6G9Z0B7_9NOCA|nr:phospholipase D-like domain-containing protein [Nocardia terpenica]QIS19025.1 cardiolipin synthase [Nocardia terpenica]
MRHTVIRRCTLAVAAAAATLVAAALPAHAATAFSLVVFPDQDRSTVYDFINSATRSIDMTMYELRDSTAVDDLVAKQQAGVAVRVILDRTKQSVNDAAYTALSNAGAGVTWSSSDFVFTHQKTLTVDGERSLIMSGNLDDHYYTNDRDYGVYDSDSADVGAIEHVFAADFAQNSISPTDGDDLVWSPTAAQDRLLGLINGAQRSLDVEELEFGDAALVDALAAAAQRGVTVRVVGMNPSSYGSQFDEVKSAGGQIVTYSSSGGLYVHAKAIVADNGTSSAKVFVGSENFSDNSLNKNRELGLIIGDSGVVGGVEQTIDTDFANGAPY